MNKGMPYATGTPHASIRTIKTRLLVLELNGSEERGTRRNGTQRTEQSAVGVNPGYPRLGSGAIGVAPSAAVAVDNPSGLSPAVGSGTNCPKAFGQFRRVRSVSSLSGGPGREPGRIWFWHNDRNRMLGASDRHIQTTCGFRLEVRPSGQVVGDGFGWEDQDTVEGETLDLAEIPKWKTGGSDCSFAFPQRLGLELAHVVGDVGGSDGKHAVVTGYRILSRDSGGKIEIGRKELIGEVCNGLVCTPSFDSL